MSPRLLAWIERRPDVAVTLRHYSLPAGSGWWAQITHGCGADMPLARGGSAAEALERLEAALVAGGHMTDAERSPTRCEHCPDDATGACAVCEPGEAA